MKVLRDGDIIHEVVLVEMPQVYPNQKDFWGTACGARFDDFELTEVFDGKPNCMACIAEPLNESEAHETV